MGIPPARPPAIQATSMASRTFSFRRLSTHSTMTDMVTGLVKILIDFLSLCFCRFVFLQFCVERAGGVCQAACHTRYFSMRFMQIQQIPANLQPLVLCIVAPPHARVKGVRRIIFMHFHAFLLFIYSCISGRASTNFSFICLFSGLMLIVRMVLGTSN